MNKAYKNYIESLSKWHLEDELDRQYTIERDCRLSGSMRYRAYLKNRACMLLLGGNERLYKKLWLSLQIDTYLGIKYD